LCREAWDIDPEFDAVPPESAARIEGADAALLIGDPALFRDPGAAGFRKIDLGAEWTRLTGLPFVWAFWAGRPDAIDAAGIEALQRARDEGSPMPTPSGAPTRDPSALSSVQTI